jgi:hypothetical protein
VSNPSPVVASGSSEVVSPGTVKQTRKTHSGKSLPLAAVPAKRKNTGRGGGQKRKRVGKDTSNCLGYSVQGDPETDFAVVNEMDVDVVEPSLQGHDKDQSDLVNIILLVHNQKHSRLIVLLLLQRRRKIIDL